MKIAAQLNGPTLKVFIEDSTWKKILLPFNKEQVNVERLVYIVDIPKRIQVDKGSDFISKDLDRWAYENNVTLNFSRPGKPTDNPFIESFNGSFRDECLSVNWFLSIEDAIQKIQVFKDEYNQFRPHSLLGGLTPFELVEKSKTDPEFSILSLS